MRKRVLLLCICFLLVLFLVDARRRRKKIESWQMRMAERQGPNACVVEEVPDLNFKMWTECKYWSHRKICGRKAIIRYECCEGYVRVRGERGCTGVKPMRNVLETAEDLGATIFVQYLHEAGFDDRMLRSGTVTLFAPSNTAMEAAFKSESPEIRRMIDAAYRNPRSPLLLQHLVEGRLYTNDLDAETMVNSMNPDHQLRLNKYSHRMVTVNCVPILRKDQEATNGVVHLIDSILIPEKNQDIYGAIDTDGRFDELSRLLRETGIDNQLLSPTSHTIFAPSDEEFTNIPRAKREQLKKNPKAMKELIGNHVIPYTVCLPAILNEHKMTTLSGNSLTLSCNETGIYVDGSRIVGESLSGTNGVVHVVRNLIMPEKVKSVWDLGMEYKLETFLQLARKTGIISQLENYGDVTVFGFTDEAFKELSLEEQEMYKTDLQKARDLLRFHIVPGRYMKKSLTNDQKLSTIDGQNALRYKIYRKGCGVESAMINKSDIEGLNGVLHIVDRVLKPPSTGIFDTLQADGNYSIMLEALERIRTIDPKVLNVSQLQSGSLTLFLPSNQAFQQLGEERMRFLLQNNTYLERFVKNHLVNNMISTGSFQSTWHYSVQTEENVLEVSKRAHGLRINKAVVTKPDIVTREGIIHVVDRVLMPEDEKKRKKASLTSKMLSFHSPSNEYIIHSRYKRLKWLKKND